MADKWVDSAAMDAALANIADHGNQLHLCSAAPAYYNDVLTKSLGFITQCNK